MDKRSLWIGIGSGMMIGAILLQLATVGQKALSDTNLDPAQSANMTKEQLESAAKSLDMKLVNAADELYTEEEWLQKKKQESSQMQGKTAVTPNKTSSATQPTKPEQPQQPKSDNVKEQSEVKQPTMTEPEEPSQPKGEIVTFKVRSGNSLAMVAENLKQAGVVSDAEAFIQAGRAEGINRKIRVGTYTLEKGESFKSIITKITKEPSS
ncbi:endolytic transglycosylase MltG [Paenibacillus barcinonensis]|uniref:Endolytic transglycosylase MltG n=1 Tax=Paenibacillus barcinonensis TaxID=198119 RepID=A0A2V4VEA1_PAEBA|nr:endolytic transglycosylase MltG [Paenibacillus barcinonensis]PYE52170.1 YceG-like family protein [Paenibacillus barcinonensis]QKS59693.1 endolytic transglycosylase MltG [Paenibacillus barcinonensis]